MGLKHILSDLLGKEGDADKENAADITVASLSDGKTQFDIIPHNIENGEHVTIVINADGSLHTISDEDGLYNDTRHMHEPANVALNNIVPDRVSVLGLGHEDPKPYTASELAEKSIGESDPNRFLEFTDQNTGSAIALSIENFEGDDGSKTEVHINPAGNTALLDQSMSTGDPSRTIDGQMKTDVEQSTVMLGTTPP